MRGGLLKNEQRVDVESIAIRFFGDDEFGIHSERQSLSDVHAILNDNVISSVETLGKDKCLMKR